jgi:aryl-alcohol dehydrogenase-like predicted oxidoreductase
MKLGLGTAQFGVKYGINNGLGKPDISVVNEIISCAIKHGISLIDTAAGYGDSEDVLGKSLPSDYSFQIVTKTSQKIGLIDSVSASLKKMRIDQIYGVLIHDFSQFKSNPRVWSDLLQLKFQGIIKKIGFSLYHPQELEILLDKNINFDIIQIPYNVFDQRFEPYFSSLKKAGVEVHIRSVFLQGLVFKNPDSIHPFFSPIQAKLNEIVSLSKAIGQSIQSLCLNFVYSSDLVDRVIIGVDSVANLESNIAALKDSISFSQFEMLKDLKENNEQMILPYNWKI